MKGRGVIISRVGLNAQGGGNYKEGTLKLHHEED